MDDAYSWVMWTLLCVQVLLYLPAMILFLARMDRHPIRPRLPVLTAVLITCFVIDDIVQGLCVLDSAALPAGLFAWVSAPAVTALSSCLFAIGSDCLLLRYAHVFCRYRLTQARILAAATGPESGTVSSVDRWLLRHPHAGSPHTISVSVAALAVFHAGIALVYLLHPSAWLTAWQTAWSAMVFAGMVVFAYALRPCHDGFSIRWELINVTRVSFVAVVADIVFDGDGVPITLLVRWVAIQSLIVLTLIMPLVWSVRQVGPARVTMSEMLETTVCRAAFRLFLASEFCIENLLFLDEVDAFHSRYYRRHKLVHFSPSLSATPDSDSVLSLSADKPMPDEDRLQVDAQLIYDKFIKRNAPFEVTLSGRLRDRYAMTFEDSSSAEPQHRFKVSDVVPVGTGMSTPQGSLHMILVVDSNVFREAAREVTSLLENGPWVHFQQTPIAQELLHMGC